MLRPLVLGVQGFQLAQVGGKLHLHEDQRIAGGRGFHFRRRGGFALHVVDDALEQVALAELLDGGRLVLDGLPHPNFLYIV